MTRVLIRFVVGYFLTHHQFLKFVPEIFHNVFSFGAKRQNWVKILQKELFKYSGGYLTLNIYISGVAS